MRTKLAAANRYGTAKKFGDLSTLNSYGAEIAIRAASAAREVIKLGIMQFLQSVAGRVRKMFLTLDRVSIVFHT